MQFNTWTAGVYKKSCWLWSKRQVSVLIKNQLMVKVLAVFLSTSQQVTFTVHDICIYL